MDEKLLLMIVGVDAGYDFVAREIEGAVVRRGQIDVVLRRCIGGVAARDGPGRVLNVDSIRASLSDQTEKISLFLILHAKGWMVRMGNVATDVAQIGGPASSQAGVIRDIYTKSGDSLPIDQQIVRADVVVAIAKWRMTGIDQLAMATTTSALTIC